MPIGNIKERLMAVDESAYEHAIEAGPNPNTLPGGASALVPKNDSSVAVTETPTIRRENLTGGIGTVRE